MPRGTLKPSQLWAGTLAASAQALGSEGALRSNAEPDVDVAHAVDVFVQAWFEGDGEGMIRCLHPDLMARLLQAGAGSAPSVPVQALTRLQGIHASLGARVPMERRRCDISVLDVQGHAASVRAVLGDWVAYVHLALAGGRWTIVNVMWEWLSNRSA